MEHSKQHAKRIIMAYGIGVLVFAAILYTPFFIPCIWKMITGIPCPGCGLTRAFIFAVQFNFIEAVRMNILFLPLSAGMTVFFVCALADVFAGRQWIKRVNSFLAKKWVVALAAILTALSWYYNIVRGV